MKNKPVADLSHFVKEGRERLRTLKFDLAAGKVKDVGELRSLRKDIARAMTFLNHDAKSVKQGAKK